jgi:hypothetical protein
MKRYVLAATAIAALVGATACSGNVDVPDDDAARTGQGALAAEDKAAGGKPGEPGSGGANGDPGCDKPNNPSACFTFDAGALCTNPNGKDLALQMCASKGAILTEISTDHSGGCSVTCCSPPPPPPQPACTWSAIGDGSSCISYGDLKTKAVAICAAQGAFPQSIYPAGDCANGATIAKLECCASHQGPPKPGVPPPPK